MKNKIFNKVSLLTITLTISLVMNFIFIGKTMNFEKMINENMTNTIRFINSDLETLDELLGNVSNSEEINEFQYSDIFFTFQSFDSNLKNLYIHHHGLGSNVDGFSFPDFILDMSEYIFVLGKERSLCLNKNREDDVGTIRLTKKEIEEFTYLKNSINKILDIFSKYKINNVPVIENWIEIMDEMYKLRPDR